MTGMCSGIPLVTDIDVKDDLFAIIKLGDLLRVDGDRGIIEIIG